MVANVQNSFRVPRANDRTIINLLEELMQEHGFQPCNIRLVGAKHTFGRSENQALFERLVKGKLFSISTTSGRNADIELRYTRGIAEVNPNNNSVMWSASPSWDTVEIAPMNDRAIDPLMIVAIADLINKRLPPQQLASAEALGPAEATVAAHSAMIERLEQALTDMAERHSADRVKLENEYDDRRQKFNDETDALRLKLNTELDGERQAVSVQRQELEERARELDDRQNTHVRRDIRKELKAQLDGYKTAFGLTTGTRRLRWPIHAVVGIVITLLIAGIVFFVSQAPPADGWAYALYLLKPLGLTFFAVAIATWYINWMNRWFERHADVEFRLKELELDIDRASWLVETAFEWKKAGEAAMPDKMLEAIGRNLFVGRDEAPAAGLNPVDQLASALLGTAAHAKLNVGGHELSFDRKALKKAGQEG